MESYLKRSFWSKYLKVKFLSDLESNFDGMYFKNWFENYWTISIPISVVYLYLVFNGKRYMRTRKPYDLRTPLTLWNCFLAVFSILASIRGIPVLTHLILTKGFHYSYCNSSTILEDSGIQFWAFLFTLSKVLELGDTAFIILRKKKLYFLHYYHHVITMIYVFYGFSGMYGVFRWFGLMNCFVHSVMYTYYALRSMRVRVPRILSMLITTLQIVQLIVGCYISIQAFEAKMTGKYCEVSLNTTFFGVAVYTSFLALFINYFVATYILKFNAEGDLLDQRKGLEPESKGHGKVKLKNK